MSIALARHNLALDPPAREPTGLPSQRIFPGRLGISPEEFSRATGLSRTSTYLALQRGEIPIKRIGRRLIIPLSALDAWLSEQDDPSAA
jgi:excisionase family DNA binding protein